MNPNFLGLPAELTDPNKARVVVQIIPFEETVTYGTGADRGPEAILQASCQVEFFDAELGFSPVEKLRGIWTTEPMEFHGQDGQGVCDLLRAQTLERIESDKFVVTLGGEHTSTIGAVQAHCEAFEDVTVIQFDAHSDLRESYEGNRWSHACAMARVLDFHDSLVQVGIRSQAEEERRIADERAIPVYCAHEIHRMDEDGVDWIEKVLESCRTNVYISFDCDVFDPSVIPTTGTPEPGGLTWRQVNKLLSRLCRSRRLIGIDVTELAPIEGIEHPQYTVAKMIYRTLGWIAPDLG